MNEGVDLVKLIGQMFIDEIKSKMIVSQLAQNSARLEIELEDIKKKLEPVGTIE